MKEQSHRLVMTTSVMGSAFHTGDENMKIVEKESQQVWKCNRTKKFAQGAKSPFVASVLVAGMGDPIPDVKFEKKSAKKAETKAVKPEENK
jgi:hypothetical protein|tara:strand:+ start:326 stop:598 length:273 start_codon:yes stop_codon:yes gene_type:complete